MKVSIFCAVLALVSVSPFTLATKINVDSQQGQVEQATIVKDEFDDGSKIEILLLDESTVNKFVLLGRVWGFLKYHHPAVAGGKRNWDYDLFRVLPSYTKAKSAEERDAILLDWIGKLGEVQLCNKCQSIADDAFHKPNHEWITHGVSLALSEKLQFILNNRHQGPQHYVEMAKHVGNPVFKNEQNYAHMAYPDDGFRLLAVYRYWNMINYFFPYKHLTDQEWDSILAKHIKTILNAKNELDYEVAVTQMISDVEDSHATLRTGNDKINEALGYYFAPFHTTFVGKELVVDALFEDEKSASSGIQIGDIITHIDERAVKDIVTSEHEQYPASNQSSRLRNMSFNMPRSTDDSVLLSIIRDGKSLKKTINLYFGRDIKGFYFIPSKEASTPSFTLLQDNIAYLTLQTLKASELDGIVESIKGTKGLIVDLRNYPATNIIQKLVPALSSQYRPFVKFTKANINYPGEFNLGPAANIAKTKEAYQGKVVVLVNEMTQSHAEFVTMALQATDRATVIGSTTSGADGNISAIVLPGGLGTRISGVGVYYPDGRETQRAGIAIDIKVKPTIQGIKNGEDELIIKAIDIINTSQPPS